MGSKRGGHSMRNKNCTIDDNDIMTISRLNPIINDCSLFISPPRKIAKLDRLSECDKSNPPSSRAHLSPHYHSRYKSIYEIEFFVLSVWYSSSVGKWAFVWWIASKIPSTLSINFPFRIYLPVFSSFGSIFVFFRAGNGEAQVWVHKKFITLDPLSPG